jgi:hypothetical protein
MQDHFRRVVGSDFYFCSGTQAAEVFVVYAKDSFFGINDNHYHSPHFLIYRAIQ